MFLIAERKNHLQGYI